MKKKIRSRSKLRKSRSNNINRSLGLPARLLMQDAVVKAKRGQVPEAIISARKAHKLTRGHLETLVLLGNLYLSIGEYTRSIRCFKKACEKNQFDFVLMENLAEAYCAGGAFSEAEELYQVIITKVKPQAKTFLNYGTALIELGRVEQAQDILLKSLELDPTSLITLSNLSLLSKQTGDKEQSVSFLRKAFDIDPRNGEVAYNYSMVKNFSEGDCDVERIERAKSECEAGTEDNMFFSFALGKVYEEVGRYNLSIANLNEANAIWRSKITYDVCLDVKRNKHIESRFSSQLFKKHDFGGNLESAKAPIFIVGMPRSGTTLVEQIISTHSQVCGLGELPVLQRLAFGYSKAARFPDYINSLTSHDLLKMGQVYIDELLKDIGLFQYFTDKMPSNYQLIGLIRLILPNAKVIHCRRMPLDTCLSCYSLYFPFGQKFSYNLTELGQYYRSYSDLMKHWHKVLGTWYYTVDYEKLICDPQEETRQMLNFCELKWEDQVLEFYHSKRQVETASATQVRQPIYRSAINRWQKFDGHLNDLMAGLGPLSDLTNNTLKKYRYE